MMYKKECQNFVSAISILMLTLVLSCSGGKEEMKTHVETYKMIEDVPKEAWDRLAEKKIFFAHQSVGGNIIDGIQDLMQKYPKIKLHIIKTRDISQIKHGCFAHSPIGQNVNPISKIDDFAQVLEDNVGGKADIAFLKLCFVDIHTRTNLDEVFTSYQKKMSSLENKYPDTTLVHMTVPLTSTPEGFKKVIKNLKGFVKKLLGKMNFYDNRIKQEYNDKLRDVYGKGGLLFDLAQSESTDQKGNSLTFKDGQRDIQTLVPEYTYDGGHLGESGKRKVAEDLLLFLVNLK